MIVAGINCQKCTASVLDNPKMKTCYHCGTTYPDQTLDLVTIHHQAKMKLVGQNLDPVVAVTTLAQASIKAAILYKD